MKVVLAHGCFDVFHFGHLAHLQFAKMQGEILIVSVTEDEYVNKGPNRPAFPLSKRMAVLRALAIVDNVIPSKNPFEAISKVKPNIYVKGKEYRGKLPEQDLVETYGGRVVFSDEEVFSSTLLLARGDLDLPCLGGRGRHHR